MIRQCFSGRTICLTVLGQKPSQGCVPADLTLASDFSFSFHCKVSSSLVLRRPIETTPEIGQVRPSTSRARFRWPTLINLFQNFLRLVNHFAYKLVLPKLSSQVLRVIVVNGFDNLSCRQQGGCLGQRKGIGSASGNPLRNLDFSGKLMESTGPSDKWLTVPIFRVYHNLVEASF